MTRILISDVIKTLTGELMNLCDRGGHTQSNDLNHLYLELISFHKKIFILPEPLNFAS